MRRSRLSLGLALATILSQTSRVSASGLGDGHKATYGNVSLDVSYKAPPSCLSPGVFFSALGEHLRFGEFSPPKTSVVIDRAAEGFEAEVRTQRVGVPAGNGMSRVTRLQDTSCEAPVKQAAFTVAMTRRATLLDHIRAAVVASQTGSTPEATAASLRNGGDVSGNGRDEGLGTRVSAPPSQEGEGEGGESVRRYFGVTTQVSQGVLPQLSWGAGLMYEQMIDDLSFRVSGSAWKNLSEKVSYGEGLQPEEVGFQQMSATVAVCSRRSLVHGAMGRLLLSGCFETEMRRLRGVQSPRHRSS